MAARNELDRLAAARPAIMARTEDIVDDAGQDLVLRQILATDPTAPATAGARQRARRPARRRQAIWLAGTASLAAAAAAIAVVATSTTAPTTVATPHPGANGLSGQPGRAYLLAMAAKTSHGQAGQTGQFWCSSEIQAVRELVGAGDKLLPPPGEGAKSATAAAPAGYQYSIVTQSRDASCLSADGTRNEGGVSGELGAKPATAADAAAWQRDGSPTRWLAWYAHQFITTTPGQRTHIPANAKGPVQQPWGSDASLPADPAKLRGVLLSIIPPASSSLIKVTEQQTGRTYDQLAAEQLMYWAEMVMKDPVQPAVRAAAYQVLASIPGIQVKPGVKDPDGRTGTAVWLAANASLPTGWRPAASQQGTAPLVADFGKGGYFTIVDPATGYLLATETVTSKQTDGFAPGTFLNYAVYTTGWTSSLPSWAKG